MSRRDPVAVVAVALLLLVVLGALLADVAAVVLGVSGDAVDPARRFADAGGAHLLGTDALGRDLFVRLLLGARTSVAVAVAAAAVATVLGVVVGVVAARAGGVVDAALMRLVDALVALPALPLVLLFAAVDVGQAPSASWALTRVVVLLSVLSWMTTARLVRAQVRQVLALDHVAAARALGATERRIVVVHVLPLCAPTVLVQATLEAAENLVAEGALSFLGLVAVDPPTALAPAALLFFTAATLQLAGDALRERWVGTAVGGAPAGVARPRRGSSETSAECP